MLDDLKMIHDRDAHDALGVAAKQWQQLDHIYDVDVSAIGQIDNIIVGGMGGSAFPAGFLGSWPGTLKPLEIVRNYELPLYAGERTLFISSSYSGNTEETLAALHEAETKGAQIAVIAAGGKLAAYATEKGYPLFTIPGGIQPRMSSFFFLVAMVQLLEGLQLVRPGSSEELRSAGMWLKEQHATWLPGVPIAENPAKQLAQELMGKSVVVYAGPKLFPAANKFKIACNESAKNVAWTYSYPEFNHNEFMGWTSHPQQKPYAVVEFRSNLEHERVQKRFVVSERLLSGMRPAPLVIEPKGDTLIQQLLWSANFGEFVSLYLALLNGIDPTPVALIEKLKAELDK